MGRAEDLLEQLPRVRLALEPHDVLVEQPELLICFLKEYLQVLRGHVGCQVHGDVPLMGTERGRSDAPSPCWV